METQCVGLVFYSSMPLYRVGFVSHVHAVIPLASSKPGQICRLSDGRLGVLLSVEGPHAKVRVFNARIRNPIDVIEPLLELRHFDGFVPKPVNTNKNFLQRHQTESYLYNDKLGFPKIQGRMSEVEVIDFGKSWTLYNGFSNSVGKHNEVILGAATMKEQDAFYVKHGFASLDGKPTAAMLEPQENLTKVVVLAHPENMDRPRHAALMGPDGLWDVKLGQGPHVKLQDISLLTGGDAGSLARMYVKCRE